MNDINESDERGKLREYESDCDEKMDYIIYELRILILNTVIDVLEKLNERNEDQMRWQTITTYI